MDSKKPWAGKQQVSSVTTTHTGMRSPLNKGHTAPLPKSSAADAPKKK